MSRTGSLARFHALRPPGSACWGASLRPIAAIQSTDHTLVTGVGRPGSQTWQGHRSSRAARVPSTEYRVPSATYPAPLGTRYSVLATVSVRMANTYISSAIHPSGYFAPGVTNFGRGPDTHP